MVFRGGRRIGRPTKAQQVEKRMSDFWDKVEQDNIPVTRHEVLSPQSAELEPRITHQAKRRIRRPNFKPSIPRESLVQGQQASLEARLRKMWDKPLPEKLDAYKRNTLIKSELLRTDAPQEYRDRLFQAFMGSMPGDQVLAMVRGYRESVASANIPENV